MNAADWSDATFTRFDRAGAARRTSARWGVALVAQEGHKNEETRKKMEMNDKASATRLFNATIYLIRSSAGAVKRLGSVSSKRLYDTGNPDGPGADLTPEEFQAVIGLLIELGVISQSGDTLTWIGGAR